MSENIAAYFNTSEFADAALWKGTTTINVIFDHGYTEQFGTAGNQPFIAASASDFTGVAKGQTLVINAVNYTIKTHELDGTGLIRIELLKA